MLRASPGTSARPPRPAASSRNIGTVHDHTLTTIAEESGFRRTGRTDEVTRLCAAFAAAWPRAVQSHEFGRSAQGWPMRALLVSRADARKVPLLMLQAGIHPGESDG